jgi:hypothetical protein
MITEIAKKLELDKSSAWRRVRIAMERGYVKNLEDRRGRPARLVPGDPLPADIEILPAPEQLQGCTVAGGREGVDQNNILDDASGEDGITPRRSPSETTATAQPRQREVFAL